LWPFKIKKWPSKINPRKLMLEFTVCTRLSLSDYMALGLMYVEHIFYIEPDLLFHAQTAS
jgi:hypothetical protein